jgi:hypothetical protein
MEINVGKELAALERLTVGELRGRYAEVFGEATNARHKQWLVRRIIWRMQAAAEGDLSDRARQRAAELANDADLRVSVPRINGATTITATPERMRTPTLRIASDRRLPIPGSVITRQYKGRTLQVQVLDQGFEFEGETYKSLSAVAKAITGQHCNGYLFFRLNGQGGAK